MARRAGVTDSRIWLSRPVGSECNSTNRSSSFLSICFFIGWRWIDPRSRFRLIYLVIASFVFYSWADWWQTIGFDRSRDDQFPGGIRH